MSEDVYLKKVMDLNWRGKTLQFRLSQDLFSSFRIDVGSRFLLRTVLQAGKYTFRKILDLGCGYGPLGLALKSTDETAVVHMVDRDALAVEFTRQNADLNKLSGVQVYGSLGYDDVCENDFDLIISNIPGKAGESVITYFLRDARYFVRPGGLVAIVVVTPIGSVVRSILDNTPDIDVVLHEVRSGHAVFHYRFTGESGETGSSYGNAIERGVYHRDEILFRRHDITWQMRTARGLTEFDSLHYRTELLLDGLYNIKGNDARHAVVMNPGQGHVPVFLEHIFRPDKITLVDRDLLSLRYSQRNLAINGCPEESVTSLHGVGFSTDKGDQAGLIAVILREEEGQEAVFETVQAAAGCLTPGGILLVSGGSTAIVRLTERIKAGLRLDIIERAKRKGYCLAVMKTV